MRGRPVALGSFRSEDAFQYSGESSQSLLSQSHVAACALHPLPSESCLTKGLHVVTERGLSDSNGEVCAHMLVAVRQDAHDVQADRITQSREHCGEGDLFEVGVAYFFGHSGRAYIDNRRFSM